MDLVYQISALRARFSATEHRIADACLKDLTFAASATIDQLAARAGVSRSALSRFAKTMGCQDIRDLRMQLAQAQTVGARFNARAAAHAKEDGTRSGVFGAVVADIETILHGQLRQFDSPMFEAAVALLDHARTVHSYGMGGASTVMADECQHRLVRLGKAVAAYHDPVLMRMASAVAGPDHLIIALSLTGLTPELLDAIRIAQGYGAKVLAITMPDSPLAHLADVTLPLRVDETDFIYKPTAARYGMLLAIDILMTQFALLHAEANQERLRRVKLVLDSYRDDGRHDRLPLGD
ncbi:RpiR family transcriptional regulator [Robbsia andropogonis]|uniref:RpiR family transcriptional regulator n=1 Tax=Robbsia andropogonis TaxID=28092 RepID=A0A0F5JZM2_9BURK|nr:MurR/RpiR family transcriptional regulator [Robbsia andropogonis]KKB63054.1 RpiR family transcriptional regulator [Robbsia andropogonis]